ncbi:MAG: hypothetical protein WA994_11670 [Ornithinimicrobium sp.]
MSAAPLVFIAVHPTRTCWPSFPWEVGMTKLGTGLDAEWARESFRVEVSTTMECDAEQLDTSGFYSRHPFGNFLAGKTATPSPALTPHYCSRQVAARRIARFVHDCDVVAYDAVATAASLDLFMRSQGIAPHWTGDFTDVSTLVRSSVRLAKTMPMWPPMNTDALTHALWVREVFMQAQEFAHDAAVAHTYLVEQAIDPGTHET